jgi:hypothetical protein
LIEARAGRGGAAGVDIGGDDEGLANLDAARDDQVLDRDLGGHGLLERERVELHAELRRTVGFGEHVAACLDAIGDEHGAPDVAGGKDPVRELERRLEIAL